MKKLCSIFLILCMLLSLVIVPTAASTTTTAPIHTIGASDTQVTIAGVSYKVIRNAADFKAMAGTDVNYILAGNIDFATDGNDLEVKTLVPGWTGTLEGNGYSLLNYKVTTGMTGGLFDLFNNTGTITIKNLTVGSATDPILAVSTDNNGGMAAICGRMQTGSTLNCENVHVYINTTGSTKYCIGGFIGQLGGATATFTKCTVNGVLETSAGKIGGFVGNASSGTINLNYSTSNVTIQGTTNNAGPIVGQQGAVLNVIDENTPPPVDDPTGGQGSDASAIVKIPGDATTITLEGVSYTVIRTVDDFKAITATTGNVILANDLDFNGADYSNVYMIASGWSGIFEGNGCTVHNYTFKNTAVAGLFDTFTVKSDVVLRNLTIGTKDLPILVASNGNGGIGLVTGRMSKGSTVRIENCVAYGNLTDADPAALKYQKGVFVGCINNSADAADCQLDIINCTAYGTVSGNAKLGGILGNNYAAATVNMKNCVSNVSVTGLNYLGGLIGIVQAMGETNLENCVSNAMVTATVDTAELGGFVGKNTGVITFRFCENKSTLIGGNDQARGAFIGNHTGVRAIFALKEGNPLPADWAGMTPDGFEPTVITMSASDITSTENLKNISASGIYTLKNNLTLSEKVVLNLAANADVTLDLNGYTITGSIEVTGVGSLIVTGGKLVSTTDEPAISVKADTTLHLEKTTVEGKAIAIAVWGTLTEKELTVNATGVGVACYESANVTLSATITAGTNAIHGVSASSNEAMNVSVKGGILTSTSGDAILWESIGTLTVEAGLIQGSANGAAATLKAGTVNLNNGTFTGKYAISAVGTESELATTVTVIGGTYEGTTASLNCTGSNSKGYNVNVTGGSFKNVLTSDAAAGTVAVMGGTFTATVSENCMHPHYVCVKEDGADVYTVEYHTHNYEGVEWINANSGSHKKPCTICEEAKMEAHKWGTHQDLGDGNHGRVCSECGAKSNARPHSLTCTDNGDGTHTSTCENCTLNETVAHVWGDATAKNGKHEKACTACGNKITEDCTAGDDGKCTTCGATVATQGNTEKKGCGSVVSGGLVALLSIMAIPAVIIRKKKEY